MLKIGEFSKLSHLTVKALRFYEKKGLLIPASTDKWTGYRSYCICQLDVASKIKFYRQLGLSIDEIKSILSGSDPKRVLEKKLVLLRCEREDITTRLSIIDRILKEDEEMKYHVIEKEIPEQTVYFSEALLHHYCDMMHWIPKVKDECREVNPGLKCVSPPYEFIEYLDGEYKEHDIVVRYNEAVTAKGKDLENIRFKTLKPAKVLSLYHRGSYENLGEAYAYIMRYAERNGYKVAGYTRECYIDGIWNKDDIQDWLTEIQLPVK